MLIEVSISITPQEQVRSPIYLLFSKLNKNCLSCHHLSCPEVLYDITGAFLYQGSSQNLRVSCDPNIILSGADQAPQMCIALQPDTS